jgi:hypothetical protein
VDARPRLRDWHMIEAVGGANVTVVLCWSMGAEKPESLGMGFGDGESTMLAQLCTWEDKRLCSG